MSNTEFEKPSFSVTPSASGGDAYRDGWERTFGKKTETEETEPAAKPTSFWKRVADAFKKKA